MKEELGGVLKKTTTQRLLNMSCHVPELCRAMCIMSVPTVRHKLTQFITPLGQSPNQLNQALQCLDLGIPADSTAVTDQKQVRIMGC